MFSSGSLQSMVVVPTDFCPVSTYSINIHAAPKIRLTETKDLPDVVLTGSCGGTKTI